MRSDLDASINAVTAHFDPTARSADRICPGRKLPLKMKYLRTTVLLLLPALSASAHHSRVGYNSSTITELRGTVERIIWTNPHIRMTLSVPSETGETEQWQLEGMDVTRMDRAGIPHDLIKEGSFVLVAGDRSTRGDNRMFVRHVLLPDRTELLLAANTEPRWEAEATRVLGADFPLIEAFESVAGDEEGIFRVWFPIARSRPGFAANPPFTAEGRAANQAYDPVTDDPVLDCRPPGMPRVMTRTGARPIEFVDDGDQIVMQVEPFAQRREIGMTDNGERVSLPRRPLGYSRGYWEGRTLVVTTTGIDWPYFQLYGFEGGPQSAATEIIERFTLSEDERSLAYDITLIDPVNYSEPLTVQSYLTYESRPGGRLMPYLDCTTPLTD
jgi:hypothetical protein